MADYLSNLPTDEIPLDVNERHIFDSVVKPDGLFSIFAEFKSALIAGVLFFIVNLPHVETFLKSFIPYAKSSPISLQFVKAFIFVIIIFLAQNYKFMASEN